MQNPFAKRKQKNEMRSENGGSADEELWATIGMAALMPAYGGV
jgi:hypothetical protein